MDVISFNILHIAAFGCNQIMPWQRVVSIQ